MKILLCHNYYQQRGGEDQVFADEGAILEANGHSVIRYTLHNDSINDMGRLEATRRTLWDSDAYDDLIKIIRREQPALMHCTNTFPLISPAAYYAAQRERVAVVQSLHNYRLLCPNSLLLRDGRVCNDCLGKRVTWPAMLHGCYRHSRSASAVVTAMLALHRSRKTWTECVDRYIAMSEFSRKKFIDGGLPAERISVKPNFVHPDPGPGTGKGGYAVFVGRLSVEKGIDNLLQAWQTLDGNIALKIVGDGPMARQVQRSVEKDPRIDWLGELSHSDVLSIVGDAACLIMPSIAYETFGRTIIEAFAKATPVIVASHGAMQELVNHGRTGLHVAPGSSAELAAATRALFDDSDALADMRRQAREVYERQFTASDNYLRLLEIYTEALGELAKKAA
ncbi:MAG: glycosyltransferase [Woeseia sp.]|nr:glycosyltransferase [Woeseia sp.]